MQRQASGIVLPTRISNFRDENTRSRARIRDLEVIGGHGVAKYKRFEIEERGPSEIPGGSVHSRGPYGRVGELQS